VTIEVSLALALAGVLWVMTVWWAAREHRARLTQQLMLAAARDDGGLRLLAEQVSRRRQWWADADPAERMQVDQVLATWDLIGWYVARRKANQRVVLALFRWRIVDTWEQAYPYVKHRRIEQPGLWTSLDDLYLDAYKQARHMGTQEMERFPLSPPQPEPAVGHGQFPPRAERPSPPKPRAVTPPAQHPRSVDRRDLLARRRGDQRVEQAPVPPNAPLQADVGWPAQTPVRRPTPAANLPAWPRQPVDPPRAARPRPAGAVLIEPGLEAPPPPPSSVKWETGAAGRSSAGRRERQAASAERVIEEIIDLRNVPGPVHQPIE